MINNSKIIEQLLSFTDKDDFYFVQVFKRRKDNPDLEKDQIVINNFYIDSMDGYFEKLPSIIRLCDLENARAYIWVNKRNYKKLASHILKRIVDIIFTENCKALRNTFNSVASEFHAETDKKWVVDIDHDVLYENMEPFEKDETLNKIWALIVDLQLKAKREPFMLHIPTKNGFHIITRPFNLLMFNVRYPKIDVHRDNPTLLYCP